MPCKVVLAMINWRVSKQCFFIEVGNVRGKQGIHSKGKNHQESKYSFYLAHHILSLNSLFVLIAQNAAQPANFHITCGFPNKGNTSPGELIQSECFCCTLIVAHLGLWIKVQAHLTTFATSSGASIPGSREGKCIRH